MAELFGQCLSLDHQVCHVHVSTTLIAQWKEKPISFRKPRDISCFAIVVCLLVKPIFQEIDWHHEKSSFKLSPFSFNNFWSFSKTISLPVAMVILLKTHLQNFIMCRTLSCNMDGRRVFTPQYFLGSSPGSSFSTLPSL